MGSVLIMGRSEGGILPAWMASEADIPRDASGYRVSGTRSALADD